MIWKKFFFTKNVIIIVVFFHSFSDSVSNVYLTKKMWLGHEFPLIYLKKKKKIFEDFAFSFQNTTICLFIGVNLYIL